MLYSDVLFPSVVNYGDNYCLLFFIDFLGYIYLKLNDMLDR